MDMRIKDLAITESFLSVASVEGFLSLFCTLWIWARGPGLEVHLPRQGRGAQDAHISVKRKIFPIPDTQHNGSSAALNILVANWEAACFVFVL